MKIKKNNRYILVGASLVVFGLWILFSTFFPLLKHEAIYTATQKHLYKPAEIEPIDKNFSIVIPKIQANSKVVRDVDLFNSAIYQKALSLGVAHAKGTSLPGRGGNVFIFSHSSSDFLNARRYNSVFYLLSKLSTGDEIKIYFEKELFNYKVTGQKIINPDDFSYLASDSTRDTLTLMTCWPPGTSLKRLIVQAQRLP